MAETYSIQLGVGFNFEEAKQNLNKMINDLQKDYKVNINFNNVNFDKIINDYKNLQQQLQSNGIKLNTDGFKQISQDLDKVSTKMKQVGDNFVPVKNVKEWSNGIGEVVKLTEKIDAKTGQVVSKYKEVSTNVRQVRDEESKLANLMANAREKSNVKQRQEELKTIQKQAQAINKNIELEYKLKQVQNTQANDTARKLAYQEEQNRLKNTTEIQKKIERIITGSNETIAQQQTRLNRNNGQQYEQFWLKALKEKEQKTIEVENRIAQAEQKRIQKLGQEKGFASGGMFGNDSYIKAQIQAIYGADASIKSYKRTLDSAGNSQIKMTVATQQSNNQTKEFGVTIDRNTQKIYQNSEAIKVSNKHISNAFERMGNSIKQMASMALTMGLVYKGLAKFSQGIEFVKRLDQQMVQVREITGMTQEQTDKLTSSYSKMSVNLATTLTDMSKLTVELTRQGLAIDETNKRMQIFSKFNKVINGDINQSTELMTAGINSLQVDAQELSDVLVKVGAVSGTSAVEVGQIIQKSGAMAKEGKVSLQELATMGAIISEKTRESGKVLPS
ncbi:phage tail tape measure protein [Clostridium botulinum]|uniref:Phage tail tape measure protein n=1 Tax=Clostridium botulinum TaxID=1491 RepID=A0A6G4D9K2_CLOBO|nr:phage tail tape measure protein [Clostridium botulinum]NFU59494.1 phage tail tape measure protein [Clostridium botulinum]NFV47492.1 phage tail tape measure protein [Clostridium botulinum]